MIDLKSHTIGSRKVADLIPYQSNSRTHSTEQINQIASSIKEFGITAPVIIDEANGILAGHGRVLAMTKLGIEETPVITLRGLTEAQRKAYVIADNQLALNAGWDLDTLKLEVDSLLELDFDVDLLGFDDDFLVDLMKEQPLEGLSEEDEVPEVAEGEAVTKDGDLWHLGRHRLFCGDSTLVDDVDKVLSGGEVDMVFTDPPYNIDYQGWGKGREAIKNDVNNEDDFLAFLKDSLLPCNIMYVCCSWHYAHLFKEALESIGKKPKAMIVWDKVNPAQNIDRYFKQHEIIFYHGDFGGQKTLRGDVWQIKRQGNPLHPTMKPIELIELALNDNPTKKTVYDPFGGSGSTLIASEKVGKTCFSIEIEPKYCDVIIKRWQDFTGEKAIHEATGLSFAEHAVQQ